MNKSMLIRHLEQAERHLAESEAHVQLHRDHLHHAIENGESGDRQRRGLELATKLRLLHGQHVARLRAELELNFDSVALEAESEGKTDS